ncbi:oxidation resistance protein 1 [Pyxicephalus adspersus]|uniref:oxidation resistance protein 1 n=1 Tax=Pyxicephalus adspersus TaxID=30357 RepID=UPI003B590F7F
MDYLTGITGRSGRVLRGTANRLWLGLREVHFQDYLKDGVGLSPPDSPDRDLSPKPPDTGQKKTLEKKDGRRMSFQKPKGTMEYTVSFARYTLNINTPLLHLSSLPNGNCVYLTFCPTQIMQNVAEESMFYQRYATFHILLPQACFSQVFMPAHCFSFPSVRTDFPLGCFRFQQVTPSIDFYSYFQLLYVPDPDYISSVESSPSLSPISPLSPTSSEVEFEKTIDPQGPHHRDSTSSPAYSSIRPSRVVSSTSEEEEAFTEKFLKINCKYITDGKGSVSGVLLVTPNNIMFDPHKTDPLVQENGCEEYGIMCPMEEVTSAAMYKEIVNSKLKDIPVDVEQLTSMRDFCHYKKISQSNTHELDTRIWDTGNDSASTAPRSTEESLSEDVFTESELSPIREEVHSSDELRQDKSSGASSESVKTINQPAGECCSSNISDSTDALHEKGNGDPSANDSGIVSNAYDFEKSDISIRVGEDMDKVSEASAELQTSTELEEIEGASKTCKEEEHGSDIKLKNRDQSVEKEESDLGNQTGGTEEGAQVIPSLGDSETEVEELRKLWKNLTMQQAKQQRENMQHSTQKEHKPKMSTDSHGEGVYSAIAKEKRRHRSHKYLCLRVGKPMRKTFVSQASASMQQYAQRDKLEYWFAVPHERTDHLYSFFIQWSPDIYAEEIIGESSREPGFVVVKRNEDPESSEGSTNDSTSRLWEITTREDVNSKQTTSIKADLEPEAFRPNLSDPSQLLQTDQIEKLTKHLPPRTIGYPWTLVYSTAKHGMSLKTLYRTMMGLDTPVLLVIKDSDAQIFGALASEPFKVSDCFYGTGETFLFTFCPEFQVSGFSSIGLLCSCSFIYDIPGGQPTRNIDSLLPARIEDSKELEESPFIILYSCYYDRPNYKVHSSFLFSFRGEFALWLDGDLYHGRSHSCKTFGNTTLSKKEDFIVQDIEIWAFE